MSDIESIDKIILIEKDIKELILMIELVEKELIEKNIKNKKMVDFNKLMMENLILEHHEVCKKILNI